MTKEELEYMLIKAVHELEEIVSFTKEEKCALREQELRSIQEVIDECKETLRKAQ